MTSYSSRSIEDVLETHTPALMAIPGVVGTGIGDQAGKPCILVLVERKDAGLEQRIPAALDGHPVRIDEVGSVRALKRAP